MTHFKDYGKKCKPEIPSLFLMLDIISQQKNINVMQNIMLEEIIIEKIFLSKDELAEILRCNSSESIDAAMSNILSSDNLGGYLRATRFFRDIINYGVKNDSGAIIHQNFHSLGFFQIIENNLYSEDKAKRNDAVYTLGKVCSFSSIPKIKAAITKFNELDPEYTENLKFELEWLLATQQNA